MPSDKVVRFGGSMQEVIKQFEDGSTDAFDTIIEQLQDEETSMIKYNKFIVEVYQDIKQFKSGLINGSVFGLWAIFRHDLILWTSKTSFYRQFRRF